MELRKDLLRTMFICALSAPAFAANFSYTGNLGGPDDVQLFNFTINTDATVTLVTYSYAGGVNAAGQTIARGGFDPILSVFDASGARVDYNDDGDSLQVPADAVTGEFFDTYLQTYLAAGSYTVSISQYSAFPIGNLSDGFEPSGFSQFEDVDGDIRDSHWAFDILGVDTSEVGEVITPTVPVPATAWLFGSGLLTIAATARRKSGRA